MYILNCLQQFVHFLAFSNSYSSGKCIFWQVSSFLQYPFFKKLWHIWSKLIFSNFPASIFSTVSVFAPWYSYAPTFLSPPPKLAVSHLESLPSSEISICTSNSMYSGSYRAYYVSDTSSSSATKSNYGTFLSFMNFLISLKFFSYVSYSLMRDSGNSGTLLISKSISWLNIFYCIFSSSISLINSMFLADFPFFFFELSKFEFWEVWEI